MLGVLDLELLKQLVPSIIKNCKLLINMECLQIHTAFAYLGLDTVKNLEGLEELPFAELELKAKEQLVNVRTSRLQNRVFNIIKESLPHALEEQVLGSVAVVDIYIPTADKLGIAIEVNGPSHYTANGELSLKSRRKQELLEKLGYKVVQLKYSALDKLSSYGEDKRQFIAKELKIQAGYDMPQASASTSANNPLIFQFKTQIKTPPRDKRPASEPADESFAPVLKRQKKFQST